MLGGVRRSSWVVWREAPRCAWGDAGSCLWSADLSEEAFRTFIYLGEGSAVITIWGTVWMGAERAPLIDRSLAARSAQKQEGERAAVVGAQAGWAVIKTGNPPSPFPFYRLRNDMVVGGTAHDRARRPDGPAGCWAAPRPPASNRICKRLYFSPSPPYLTRRA